MVAITHMHIFEAFDRPVTSKYEKYAFKHDHPDVL